MKKEQDALNTLHHANSLGMDFEKIEEIAKKMCANKSISNDLCKSFLSDISAERADLFKLLNEEEMADWDDEDESADCNIVAWST